MPPVPPLQPEINLHAKLTRLPNGTYMVGVSDPNLWVQLALFMEVVSTLANTCVANNPLGIGDSETMADYVAQYTTRVIMGARRGPETQAR